MSAFSPVDPRDPMNRRKQLVQRLMQQYQQKVGARGGAGVRVPAVGGRAAFASADGRAFAHPRIAGHSNVAPGLLDRLGPGGAGAPLPGEMSAGPGMAAPDPGPPAFVNPGGPAATAPPGPADPGPPAGAGPPAAVGPMENAAQPAAPAPAPAATNPLLNAALPGGPAPAPSHLIPLGGGAYYDPITDTVHGTGGFG